MLRRFLVLPLLLLAILPFEVFPQASLVLAIERWVDSYQYSHNDVAFSPIAPLMAYGDDDGYVIIHNLEQQNKLYEGQWELEHKIMTLAFSPDGKHLVASTNSGRIILFNMEKLSLENQLTAHEKSVKALEFTADGKYLYSAGNDEVIQCWSFPDLKWQKTFSPGIGKLHSLILREELNQIWVASEHLTEGLVLLDMESGKQVQSYRLGHITDMCWLPTQKRLMVSTVSHHLFRIDEGSSEYETKKKAHNGYINNVQALPNSALFGTCSADNTFILRNGDGSPFYQLEEKKDVLNLDFSPDGRYLAYQVNNGFLKVWDLSKLNVKKP